MKRTTIVVTILSILLVGASLVSAGVGNTLQGIHGKHYNLNIIGVDRHGEVGDSNGHTMFVKLTGKTKIVMTQDGGGFDVVDRNGLDGSAEFNIAPGYYNIFAAALGKPNKYVDITSWGEFEDAQGTKLFELGFVQLIREPQKKPQSVNINHLFYVEVTLCTAVNPAGECIEETTYKETWVFDIAELVEYYWDYDNHGLKLLQVRFYECSIDPTGEAKDYCRWPDGSPIDPTTTKKVVVPT
jgi:hypothetical protein